MSTSNINSQLDHPLKQIILGAQMLCVAFGALVLVPILTGLNPNVALFTAGIGTLIFQLVTGRQIPIFLASSFAFIAPIIYGVQQWGIPGTLSGLFAAGLFYMLLSFLISIWGTDFIHRLLPPIVVGPVIMVIGLSLAPVAVNLAMGMTGDGAVVLHPQNKALIVSMFALLVTVSMAIFGRGMMKLIPILVGILCGYFMAMAMGMVSFDAVSAAPLFSVPEFVMPELNWQAILFIVPVAIAPAIEHIGDMLAISNVTGRNFLEKPGLKKTLLGDGLATSAAAMVGGPPNTTYSEVTGAVTLTKAFNPVIMTWAALFAVILSFCGKLGAFLSTIPTPVMGGIMTLLFGMIAAIGINTFANSRTDLTDPRNLAIIALILVFGIGGMQFGTGNFTLQGIGLSAIIGILLNLILPEKK